MKARLVSGENDTITIEAGEALTAKRIVDSVGKHTAAKEALGVCLHDTDSGSIASIGRAPIEVVEAGGTCTLQGPLKTDANGRVVDQGGSGIIVGYAMQAASDAGTFIQVNMAYGCVAV